MQHLRGEPLGDGLRRHPIRILRRSRKGIEQLMELVSCKGVLAVVARQVVQCSLMSLRKNSIVWESCMFGLESYSHVGKLAKQCSHRFQPLTNGFVSRRRCFTIRHEWFELHGCVASMIFQTTTVPSITHERRVFAAGLDANLLYSGVWSGAEEVGDHCCVVSIGIKGKSWRSATHKISYNLE